MQQFQRGHLARVEENNSRFFGSSRNEDYDDLRRWDTNNFRNIFDTSLFDFERANF